MKSSIRSNFLTIIFFSISFCLSAQIYNLSGTLSGANEVPPNGSAGTGTITGTYDQVTGIIAIEVTFSNLGSNIVNSHIHGPATTGVNAGVILPLIFQGTTSGNYLTTSPFSPTYEADLLAGNTYVNVHSQGFPGGEIRSQITATLAPPIPTLQGWALIILAMVILTIGVVVLKYRTQLS